MYLAYADESGDAGRKGSGTYSLACVLVKDQLWPLVFDGVISFRRFLRSCFRLPVRAEVKARYMIRNGGPFQQLSLSEPARRDMYRMFRRLQPKLDLLTFAVVIRKGQLWRRRPSADPRDIAWEYFLQRLERFTTKGKTRVLVFTMRGNR